MPRVNVFVDGTWLLVQCAAGQSMANATDHPDRRFPMDFARLNRTLLEHVQTHGGAVTETGDAYIATSIFALPGDFDDWPDRFDSLTTAHIDTALGSGA